MVSRSWRVSTLPRALGNSISNLALESAEGFPENGAVPPNCSFNRGNAE